jgi:PGF-pre-PGF domain-containing protein
MQVRRLPFAVILIAVTVAAAGAAPAPLSTGVVVQADHGGYGGDGGTGGGMDGNHRGGPNLSVGPNPNGSHSVMVQNVGENQRIHVRFQHRRDAPDVGVHLREMTVTTSRSGDYQFTARTAANASPGVQRFAGPAPFGYFNVTHPFPNENVSNASLTFALNRTRLRERNVSAEDVALYRYRAQNRTWDRLQTRVADRNATHVTYYAESPGLSEFAVAPTTPETTGTLTPPQVATPEPAATATPTPTASTTPTPTRGDGPGFGPLLALRGLLVFAVYAWRD